MKDLTLIVVILFSIILFVNCGGEKGEANKEESSAENIEDAETTETETPQSRLDTSKPCEWLSEDFVKSTFELGNVKMEIRDASDEYGNISCEYDWSEEETGYFGTISVTFASEAATYDSAEKAEDAMYRSADIAKKGVTSEVETDEMTEEVMEGENNNKDGKIKATFQVDYVRVSEEAGFPAVFSADQDILIFVIENKTMNVSFLWGSEFYSKDPEVMKKRLIALAKEIRKL